MRKMKVVAFDLGTTVGYASKGDTIQSGVAKFSQDRFAGGGARYLAFKKWLVNYLLENKPEEVVFEKVHRHAGTAAAHVYGGLCAILMAECERVEIPYQGYDVGAIKKFWTGKGNAKKPAMIAEAKRRGFDPADDNEADALAMVHLWMDENETEILSVEDML
jgi:Holliday junction resolvasome RuvABC endonuclease subunit